MNMIRIELAPHYHGLGSREMDRIKHKLLWHLISEYVVHVKPTPIWSVGRNPSLYTLGQQLPHMCKFLRYEQSWNIFYWCDLYKLGMMTTHERLALFGKHKYVILGTCDNLVTWLLQNT